jgi:hypothetical protein
MQLVAVRRWFKAQDHFYTTDPNGELAPTLGYNYEGVTGYISNTPLPGTTALHRWFKAPDHFYTTDANGELAPRLGYNYEGVLGYILTAPQPGTTALHRWFKAPDHFYTTDPNGELAPRLGYNYEGVTGYLWTCQHPPQSQQLPEQQVAQATPPPHQPVHTATDRLQATTINAHTVVLQNYTTIDARC